VHLNNVSGGIFGGDALKLSVQVHPGAEAQITTTGATRIYRPRPEAADAMLVSEFKVGKDALLEYLPDALIPFRSARAVQRTSYSLDEGATLFFWEAVAPGRTAAGELFDYERLKLTTEINVQGRPVYCDRLLLEPSSSQMQSPARFGSCSYLVTFVAMRAGCTAAELRALEQSLEAVVYDASFQGEPPHDNQPRTSHWGVTALPAHGVLVRGMTDSAVRIPAMLQTLWSQAKRHLCDRVAIAPRKTY
jgi:urease accessory protein